MAIWQRILQAFLIIGSVQLWIHVILYPTIDSPYLQTLLEAFLSIQLNLKIFWLNKKLAAMTSLIDRCLELHNSNYKKFNAKSEEFIKNIHYCTSTALAFIVSAIGIATIRYLGLVITNFVHQTESYIEFTLQLYWPFYVHPLVIYLYSSMLNWTVAVLLILFDYIIIFTVVILSICFDRIGDDFEEAINEIYKRDTSEGENKLKQIIDNHNKVISLLKELNSLYGILMLSYILQISLTICILGFYAMV